MSETRIFWAGVLTLAVCIVVVFGQSIVRSGTEQGRWVQSCVYYTDLGVTECEHQWRQGAVCESDAECYEYCVRLGYDNCELEY